MSVFSLTSVDFCVSDPLVIDMDTFHLWLEGASVHDAALALGTVDPVGPSSGAAPFGGGGGGVLLPAEWEQLVLADTSAQFRTFWALKPYLDEPQRLLAQRRFRIPPHLLQRVLDSYYSFDDRLMREALGRKPTPKLRRTLEAQCEKLNVSLPSCRRQADNLHRIYTSTDDDLAPGPASFAGGGGGSAPAVYSEVGVAPAPEPADAMDGYAALAPDETLAASQRQARNARLAKQTGYVDWELTHPPSGGGGEATYSSPDAGAAVAQRPAGLRAAQAPPPAAKQPASGYLDVTMGEDGDEEVGADIQDIQV